MLCIIIIILSNHSYLDLCREQAAWGDKQYDARRCAFRRKYVILHGTKDTGYQIFPRTYT